MKNLKYSAGHFAALLLLLLSVSASAQDYRFNYFYHFEPFVGSDPPQIAGALDVDFPETARKFGVEGVATASAVLGENGQVRDIKIINSLPHGVDQALTDALRRLKFVPAANNGLAVPVTLKVDLNISAVYSENDKNVRKPKIIEKPAPVYPASQRAEGWKDKVTVFVLFMPDGTAKPDRASSTMPKDFDKAAMEAAAKIKFQPAVHKKSKQQVAQVMTVVYEFKP